MRPKAIAAVTLLLLATALLAPALPAAACPVCYGEAEGPVIQGTQWSVAFLGALVYLVLGGGAGMVLVQRRRALQRTDEQSGTDDPHRGLELVPAPAPERDAD